MTRPREEYVAEAQAAIAAERGCIPPGPSTPPSWALRASPAPWRVKVIAETQHGSGHAEVVDAFGRQVVRVRVWNDEVDEQYWCTVGKHEYEVVNATHIANMREREPRLAADVLALDAEVTALREERDRLRSTCVDLLRVVVVDIDSSGKPGIVAPPAIADALRPLVVVLDDISKREKR